MRKISDAGIVRVNSDTLIVRAFSPMNLIAQYLQRL